MPAIAAIDVGSNAMRLAIAEAKNAKDLDVVENHRESVRLGHDVFKGGNIREETLSRSIAAFSRFQSLLAQKGVQKVVAVGTSALREALNREIFVDRIAQETGISVSVIGAEEEARLIFQAVNQKLPLKDESALLVDVGGGSMEITCVAEGEILFIDSFKMGTVRLLENFNRRRNSEKKFNQMVREYVDTIQKRIQKEIGQRKVRVFIGTGGNVEALGDLRKDLLGKDRNKLPADDLATILEKLQEMSFEERVQKLGLRPDRADVIVPAAIVLQRLLKFVDASEILIPNVGLKEGVLYDVAQELFEGKRVLRGEQLSFAAKQLGRKYQFDEQHAEAVVRHCSKLFDETRALHRLTPEYRTLLEVAAWLHDIGHFVNTIGHHKHTHYLLSAAPLIGLSETQNAIVANVARYHRKAFPKLQHPAYKALSEKDRVVVMKLAALLRVADALDTEHANKVKEIEIEFKKPKFRLRLKGEGDLLLEKWALREKAKLFEEVFGLEFHIEEE